MAIDTPRLQHTVGVSLFAGTTDVIHDLVVALFLHCLAQAAAELFESLVPADAFPATRAAFANALHREHDALGVIDLVQRRWALGAVAASARWMLWVTFDLFDLAGVLVEPRGQTAAGLTVETARRHQRVMLLDLVRPRLGIETRDVMPVLERWVLLELSHQGFLLSNLRARWQIVPSSAQI